MKLRIACLVALAGLFRIVSAQQTVTTGPFMATLETDQKSVSPGTPATLDFFIMDSKTMSPIVNLTVTPELTMPSMKMNFRQPTEVAGKKPGHYEVKATFPHQGDYQLKLTVSSAASTSVTLSFTLHIGIRAGQAESMQGMHGMTGMEMKGTLGDWSANREGSGTTWQPDSSPMFMKMLPALSGFDIGLMGTVQAGYVNAGGKRGDKGFFSNSMIMLMGRKELGGGAFGVHFMTSVDPIINGEFGVPNLFQTGETAHGMPLVDRQHPHNLFSEVAASYSHPLSKEWSAFAYGGPVGEPALGNVMFMHRLSGMEIPEAPISHHWFDSTHISFGVITLGITNGDRWKLEGSLFNGHEPGENRYTIGPEGLNSASGRITYNPGPDWSLSASYGFLNSPEALSLGVDQHRLTASALYSHNFSNGDNISATAYFGQNTVEGNATESNAWLAETTYYHALDSFFLRFERVDKDELFGAPQGSYTINKLLLGDVHNFYSHEQIDYGIGAYLGFYSFPASLHAYYGNSPVTLGIFLRIRPSSMK